MNEPKIWRLTRYARRTFHITTPHIRFTNRTITHTLLIADCFFALEATGKLETFQFEPRYTYPSPCGENRVYAPDAFVRFDKKHFFLEVQRTKMSAPNWAKKWERANDYVPHSNASFVLVVADQPTKTVVSGARIPIRHHKKLDDFLKNETQQVH